MSDDQLQPLELDSLLYGDEEYSMSDGASEIPADGSQAAAGLADWHMRKIVAIKAQAEFEDEIFKEQIQKLRDRRKETAEKHAKAQKWHEEPLRQWHRRERGARRLEGKKLALPSGTAQGRAASKVDVTDEEQLRAFLDSKHSVDPETGEKVVWSEQVYRKTEEFMISELTKRAKVPKKKGGREPGSIAELVTEDGVSVPGVRVLILPDTWTVSGS